jgi:hypothetical protein
MFTNFLTIKREVIKYALLECGCNTGLHEGRLYGTVQLFERCMLQFEQLISNKHYYSYANFGHSRSPIIR